MSTITETFAHYLWKTDCLWNHLSRQFEGSRRDRYTTYRFQKLESLRKNNVVHKLHNNYNYYVIIILHYNLH